MTEISNVGQLRKALEGLPDDRPILAQVVATNGQAWNLQCEFTAEPKFLKWASVMTMQHRELTSLQWPIQETGCKHGVKPPFTCELCVAAETHPAPCCDINGSYPGKHRGSCPQETVPAPRGKPCTCPDTSKSACGVERGHRLGDLWHCRRAAEKETRAVPRKIFEFDERSLESIEQLTASGHTFAGVILRDPATGHERTVNVPYPEMPADPPACGCYSCSGFHRRMTVMITCPECGNKRCPKATHHIHACTRSNAPGQPGSRYYEDAV